MDRNDNAIETRGLTRYFGSSCAVHNLDLAVRRGSVFGFLGRNGAGKTTTIRMLMGLLPPTRGTGTVLGTDCRAWTPELRGRIGYLAEGHHVYDWMRIGEIERFQASFHSRWNSRLFRSVTDHFGLRERMHAGRLSRGQRAGLCLALTLAPEPELLVLDDPALGLDPVARRSLLEAIVYVTRERGRTVLFSSHLLADVERVADEIAVMDRGVLRAHCTVDEFRRAVRQYVLRFNGRPPAAPDLPRLLHSFRTDTELAVTIANPCEKSLAALDRLGACETREVELGLEEAFICYVGDRGEKSFFLHNREESA